jgi:hypothetical protein
MRQTITPVHENLRRAVQWLSDHGPATPGSINEASVRFDLSPEDEQFLLTHFLKPPGNRDPLT